MTLGPLANIENKEISRETKQPFLSVGERKKNTARKNIEIFPW